MSFAFFNKHRTSVSFLLLILLLSLVLRISFVDLTRFEHEQVRDLTLSQSILEGNFLLHGFSSKIGEDSVQQSFGPFYYYLIAFGLLFAPDPSFYPLILNILAITFSLLAIFFCYLLSRKLFSEQVALFATFFYGVSPWYLLNGSTFLSNGLFLPFFVILYFYFLASVLIERRDWFLIPALITLALQTQIHLSSLMLFPVTLILLLMYRRDLFMKKQFYVGLLGALLMYFPYIFYTFMHKDWTGAFSFLFARYPGTYARTFIEVLGMPFMFVTPYLGAYLLGNTVLYHSLFLSVLFWVFVATLVLLVLLGFLYAFTRMTQRVSHERLPYMLLFVWYLVPSFFFIISGNNVSPHYLYILFPVPFIMLALLFDFFFTHRPRLTLSFIGLLLLGYLLFFGTFASVVRSEGGTDGMYGIPLEHRRDVIAYIHKHSGTDSPSVVYYESQKRNMNYLFEIMGMTPHITLISSLDEYREGYLIFNDFDFYSTSDKELSEEEKERLFALEGTRINSFFIVHR